MRGLLQSIGLGQRRRVANRPRLHLDSAPAAIYAVGDVHGCLAPLQRMEEAILADARADGLTDDIAVILIGDVVDRGDHSAAVIDHLLAPPPEGITRYCLAGNHELSMSGFLADPTPSAPWLGYGGRETLASYGVPDAQLIRADRRHLRDLVASYVPDEHIAFLAGLPTMITTPHHIFVHAGLRPGVPLERQTDSDLVWFNDRFAATYDDVGRVVVHGHVVVDAPHNGPARIGLDTGCYLTGVLSAVRLTGPDGRKFMRVSQSSTAP